MEKPDLSALNVIFAGALLQTLLWELRIKSYLKLNQLLLSCFKIQNLLICKFLYIYLMWVEQCSV